MIELDITGIATGGDGVGRDADGRVVFVRGALPGERVRADVTSAKKRFAHAVVTQVVRPSPDRVEPPCPHVAEGCGGCGLQHAAVDAQRSFKVDIVKDCLERIGRVEAPPVSFGGAVDREGYRTTVRVGIDDQGRPGYRRPASHDLVATPDCLIAHPAVREVLSTGRFEGSGEITIRTSAAGAETVTSADDDGTIHEIVDGRRFQVSIGSFFQPGPQAAQLLVDRVRAIVEQAQPTSMADLYSGVGLFAGCIRLDGRVIAVEASPAAVADAAVNLAELDIEIVERAVERWRPVPVDLVVADPARSGLGSEGAAVVAGTRAADVVLVSCDPGALGRDAKLLIEHGYSLVHSTVLDLFPHTTHVEVVSHFTRSEVQNVPDHP